MGPEVLTTVDERDVVGDVLERERPVDGAVPSADDEHPLTA